MKKLITLLILTLTGSFIVYSANPLSSESLLSNSNAEVYAYQYMEELNNQAYDTILDKEILAFLARYPDSNFTPYVTFFKGNISLRKGDYLSAQNIYKSLIHESLSQTVYAELLLNYAISLSYTADYGQAMYLLQQVDSEMSDPLILAEANKIRGDIYYQQGQYYSAEARYKEALKAAPKDTDIALALFTTLVKLRKDDDAISLLAAQDTASALYPNFAFCWLEYLLENERYKDFDAFIHNYDLGKAKGTTNLLEIRIRRALLVSDYDTAASLLKQSKVKESSFLYYSSIIELHEGNTVLADSTLSSLIDDKNPEIAVSAYLERLKLIYKTNPEDATNQLLQYARDNSSPVKKAEVYYTLGYFFYHMNNYSEALRQLSYSKQYDMNSELSARVEILLAESWFAANRLDVAQETFNRYLNMFPLGSARDRAWFHVGFIYFNQKDYVHSKTCFDELLRFHPDSAYANDAVYYLAEMDFFLANYNLALNGYLKLFKQTVNDSPVTLRIAQVYYYLGSYDLCEEYLALLVPSYEMCILKGSLNIAKKNYAVALDQFILAENFATERIRKVEAQSYRALSLYQLKRYREASELYLQLSTEKESPDTYLFLSAKSSYAAKDYHLALQLYDSFIDTHPESIHFLVAMSDVANIYYNMGNYGKAITDWLNILKRFRNTKQFTDSDRDVIRNSIVGLELGLKRSNTEDYFDELLTLPDTFQSSFITFELYYLIIKLYADANEWEQLINTAEKVRTEFP
ncbi:MAG: tetratricopeptide repeat protein, partial [Candidatus Cloacimonetes bacterium]|nr:tetratricopeptide repeat protein [Candidatus Cloacimonadota bacterium]